MKDSKHLFIYADQKINYFVQWSKKMRGLAIIAYAFIIILLWPIVIAYYLARQVNRKNDYGVLAKSFAIVMIGFGLLFNATWVYAITTSKSTENKSATQSIQDNTSQESQSIEAIGTEPIKPTLYTIIEIVDGDTVKVDYHGKTETVRLIGIDTPETVDPRETVQCFGQEASSRAKELLKGKSVQLESDTSQSDRDKYNRLLRYVLFEDSTNFNKQMIAEGFAYEYTYQVPYKYQQDFKNAQTEASNTSKGLWSPSSCNGQRTKPQPAALTPTPAPAPAPAPSQPNTNCAIKGNVSSSGEKIYHIPGGQYYDKTQIDTSKGERYFCSEQEATNAGWRKSKV